MTQPPHYFTAPPTDPFPCSRHVIQLRPLYNCLCHLASVVHSWFMDKMRAVIHSLGDQAYLILSGAFNSPGWALQSGIWWTMAMIFHLFRPGHSRVGIKSPIWDYFCKQMQLFHSVHTLTPAPWINCKCHMLQFCLTSLFLRTFAKSHFPFSSKQRQRYSVAEKQCLMEQPKKQLWVRQTLRLAVHHFPPLQCECIIVWAVAVRNDNRGWHWKVPKFSSLKSHWAGSDRTPQRKRGGVLTKQQP